MQCVLREMSDAPDELSPDVTHLLQLACMVLPILRYWPTGFWLVCIFINNRRELVMRITEFHPNKKSSIVFALLAICAMGFAANVSADKPGGKSALVPAGAKLEKLFDGGCVLTEGVAAASDGMIYFSDITFTSKCQDENGVLEAGHIWKFDPKTKKATIFRSPSGMSNGIKFDAAGNMIVAEGADHGGRRVIRTDMKTGKSYIIAGLFDGRKFNSPNDITIDLKGRIYFSDPRYLGHEALEQPVMAVYRIDPDGSIHRIITDAGKPNGVAISPDQKSFYLVSNDNGATGFDRLPEGAPTHKGRMALMAYDLADDGTAKFRKTLIDYSPEDGPDGLVVDAKGNLWVAVRDETRPGIYCYSPDGKELAYIKTEIPTNVGFGRGDDSNLLYITAGKSLYSIRVNVKGYQLPPSKRDAE